MDIHQQENLENLPDDIIINIILTSEPEDVLRFAETSTKLYNIIHDPAVLRKISRTLFNKEVSSMVDYRTMAATLSITRDSPQIIGLVESLRRASKIYDQRLITQFIKEAQQTQDSEKLTKIYNAGMRGAAEGGHEDLVKYYISGRADDWEGGLESAVRGKHINLVKFFLAKMVDEEDASYNDAIEIAVADGYPEILKLIINQDKNKNVIGTDFYFDMIDYAIAAGHNEVVKILLDVDKEFLSEEGGLYYLDEAFMDPFRKAMEEKQFAIAKTIIESGLIRSDLLLIEAALFDNKEIIEFILNRGDLETGDYEEAIDVAEENNHHNIVKLLESRLKSLKSRKPGKSRR